MKLSVFATLSILAVSSAFAPAPSAQNSKVVLNAEQSRMEFLSAAGLAVFGAAVAPGVAGAMDQDNVSDPTEVWETGKPSADAKSARAVRYASARTQMTSNFPPIKRTTLERKSPVTRLDINAPYFSTYKKTYPGLFRE
eukprot:CAMPEP_0113615944 /NCGR_PEP_ID=MMETSP0017_2-20120614/7972_1 /TAXON_ID=2856 /ORGANISM="Cylindrotheca closterium" /LENGTH=138 /DNA_ID=CAMNT_0000525217 /DNA_START=212 /DNA_END=628 /DNA_ORIENTATION=- /assembly_acc=CAM_ASM_000147